jgi:hypothetical protein
MSLPHGLDDELDDELDELDDGSGDELDELDELDDELGNSQSMANLSNSPFVAPPGIAFDPSPILPLTLKLYGAPMGILYPPTPLVNT